jgi:lysophospholipase L1-like esterase
VIVLAEGLGKGTHEVILQKRTEGEQGRITLHSFITEGELLQADGRKDRHIEFIGDSYTCGYGTESPSRDDPFLAETENCNLTYAAITARYFNADFNLVSHSGQGICRNYDNYRPGYNMPDRYSQVFDEAPELKWDVQMGEFRPDIVVIYLCTNDFSTGCQPHIDFFAGRYIELLKKIRGNYGEEVPILCMASNFTPYTYDYIRHACQMSGMKNISYMVIGKSAHNDTDELGASWHPNYKGHQKIASSVIPYVATMTGWDFDSRIK